MPQSFAAYPAVLALVSPARLARFVLAFKPASDAELYGAYIWSQHAAASLYPLAQNLEVTLRNAIDLEATRRFGKFWWNLPQFAGRPRQARPSAVQEMVASAYKKLGTAWKKKQRALLSPGARLPPMPEWTHDQVLGAFELGFWQQLMTKAFWGGSNTDRQNYLWPVSLGKVFRNHHRLEQNPDQALSKLFNLLEELREYRNRLFHHGAIWMKGQGVPTEQAAIESIRSKITRIEEFISLIDTRTADVLARVGIFECARRVCSINELNIYRYAARPDQLPAACQHTLRAVASHVAMRNATACWAENGHVFGLYKIR